MGRAIMLCGNDAKTPYRFVNPDVMVYTLEELCFLLRENAFLLDVDVMDKRLVAWIDNECGLRDLAAALYPLVHQKGTVSSFVMTILEYVGSYSPEQLQETEKLLKQGAELSTYEKYKTRIDYMVGRGKLVQAMAEYDDLLAILPQTQNELSAKVLHNKAVAMTGLFLFEQAAQCFMQAYDMYPSRETYIEYLAAKRMALGEKDYVSLVASIPETYEESLEVEKRVEEITESWQSDLHKRALDQLAEWKEDGNFTRYNEEKEKMIQGLKHSYRRNISET